MMRGTAPPCPAGPDPKSDRPAPSSAADGRCPCSACSASSGGSRSSLFSTSQRSFLARSALNFFNSATIERASCTGSASGSGGAISTRCSSTRVRCRCFRKLNSEPGALGGAFDQPGDVGHDEAAMDPDRDDAQIRMQRRERIVGNFRLRRRNGANQRRFSGIRQSEQPDVRHHLELEPQLALLAGQARHRLARRAVGAALEPGIAPPALAALGDQQALAGVDHIAQLLFCIDIDDNGADRDGNFEICATRAGAILAAAGRAVGCAESPVDSGSPRAY